MQKNICLIVLAVLLLLQTGCKTGEKGKEALPHNPFVEAFTSGNVSRFTPVYLIFTEDVAADKLSDAELKKHIRVRPDAKGTFSFLNPSTIMFKPETAMERNTRYEITADLGAWFDVNKNEPPFTFSFTTLPISLHAGQEGLSRVEGSEDLYNISYTLSTPDREDAQTIEPLIRVSEKADIEWLHNAEGINHRFTLKNIRADRDKSRRIIISTAPNKLGLPEEELVATTLPGLNEFNVYDIRYVEEPERYVEITFTQSLNTQQEMEGLAYIEDNTNPTAVVEENKLRLYPDADCSGSRKVFLSAFITDSKGKRLNSAENKDIVMEIEISAALPDIRFTGEGNIIPQTSNLILPFQAVYLRGVIVHVVKIFEQNIGQFLQINELSGSNYLMQVGRLVARKTIFLDEKGAKLTRWNTYAINLNELINPEPGAIYRISLSASPDLSLFPCDTFTAKPTKEQILAGDEALFKKEAARFDNHSEYYYYSESDYYDYYDYDERDNPCTNSYYQQRVRTKNILATNLGLMAKGGQDGEMLFLVHNLLTAMPEKGVRVTVYNYQHQLIGSAVTNEKGQATLSGVKGRLHYAIASQDKQRAYLRIDPGSALSLSSFDVAGEVVQKGIKGFIYGERGVWRPGDTLHLGFILNDRQEILPPSHPVTLELFNPRGQSYARKTLTQGQLGLYAFDMPTETDAPTGAWNVKVQVGGTTFEKKIRIESIKPNRLKIQLTFPDKPLLRNESADISLHTEWLHGAAANKLHYEVKGFFTAVPTSFTGYTGYNFDDPGKSFRSEESQLIDGKTDEKGDDTFSAEFDAGDMAPGMLAANFMTRVYEESGDFSIDGMTVPYSPYPAYVGIKSPQVGEEPLVTDANHSFDVVSLTNEGKPVSRLLNVEVFRMRWYWWWSSPVGETMASYISDYGLTPVKKLSFTTNTEGNGNFKLNMANADWGTYLIRVQDGKGGHSTGILAYFDWPSYGGQRRSQARSESPAMLKLRTDKESYAPGEKITVTFPSPEGSRAVASIENGTRVLSINEYTCTPKETTLQIDVTPDMQPNAYIYITLLQPYNHTDNDLPIRMYGVVPVTVSSPDSRLQPVIATAAEYKPETPYSITVAEEKGRTMAYTLAIVDEGLLDLTHFPTPDPWTTFNAREALGVATWDLYNYILGAYGGRIEQIFSIGGDDALNRGPRAVVNRFKPVVKFEGPFLLKKGEKKTHTYTMPNYNGRVRVMVVAGDGTAYGNVEKSVPVRKPVMLLGTLPRVIGTEEEMVIPATVFATEDNIGNVKVSIACSNNMQVIGSSSQDLSFTQKEDRTIRFRVRTSGRPGAGKVTLTATAKGEKSTYETDIELRSVERPQVKVEAITLEGGKQWKGNMELPGMDGTNSLTLEVSNLPPINLSKRLSELLGYPHGCLEQITSKAFPQLYLKEFASLTAEQDASVSTAVQSTLNRYRSYFHGGDFSYWPGSSAVNYWGGIYAVHFMVEASNKGYAIPYGIKGAALNTMRKAARDWKPGAPGNSNSRYDEMTQAYRLYVLALGQQPETGAMNRLRENKSLVPVSRYLLGAGYAILGRNDVAGQLIGQTSEQQSSYDAYDNTFGSQVRDWGIYLQTLVLMDKGQEAASTARKISDKLSSNSWLSTQETAFSLMGLAAYIKRYKAAEGVDFSYTINGQSKQVATGKNIRAETLFNGGASSAKLEVKNNLNSTLFVRFVSEGIPAKGEEKASANDVELTVSYLDEKGQAIDAALLKQGTNFTAVATVKNPKPEPLQNLVVSQVFPAGWEIRNTRFLQQEGAKETSGQTSYQDIRDDRVYSYIDNLPGNTQITFRINLSAIYAGKFYLPPVYCEAMYNHLIQANTTSLQVTVEN